MPSARDEEGRDGVGTPRAVSGGQKRRMDTKVVASTAVFTAFVAATTSVFSVYIPATQGYFNVGEIMVYTAALLMGPYVGAFAGGVGSMLSDLSLGYPYYAPGTLVVKGLEGFIVGYLASRARGRSARGPSKAVTLAGGAVFAVALAYIGTEYFSGSLPSTLGQAWYIPAYSFDVQVPAPLWLVLSGASFVLIAYFGLRSRPWGDQSVASVLVGGAEMVAGYYLYESFVLTLIAPASVVAALAPAAEVPVNIGQVLIGLLVSVPLVRSIRRMTERAGFSTRPETPMGAQTTA